MLNKINKISLVVLSVVSSSYFSSCALDNIAHSNFYQNIPNYTPSSSTSYSSSSPTEYIGNNSENFYYQNNSLMSTYNNAEDISIENQNGNSVYINNNNGKIKQIVFIDSNNTKKEIKLRDDGFLETYRVNNNSLSLNNYNFYNNTADVTISANGQFYSYSSVRLSSNYVSRFSTKSFRIKNNTWDKVGTALDIVSTLADTVGCVGGLGTAIFAAPETLGGSLLLLGEVAVSCESLKITVDEWKNKSTNIQKVEKVTLDTVGCSKILSSGASLAFKRKFSDVRDFGESVISCASIPFSASNGNSNNSTNTAYNNIIPTVRVSPEHGYAGVTLFEQNGSRCTPNSKVELHFVDPDGIELTPIIKYTDSNGNYTHSYQSNSGNKRGKYLYYVIDIASGKTSPSWAFYIN